MSILNLQHARALGLEEVFQAEPEPTGELLCTYLDGDDRIEARSDTFTLVLNRNIVQSVEISGIMAVVIAKKFPERRVLLVNTYAGAALMQQTVARGMRSAGLPLHSRLKPYFPADWKVEFDDTATAPFLTNFRLLDCPTSTLTALRLEQEMHNFACDLVILNSFEFSALSLWDRQQFAQGLVALREKQPLTMVIFSHEQRMDVLSLTPARGALGLIGAYSSRVWRIMTPFERTRFEQRYRRRSIHETPMQEREISTPIEEKETEEKVL